MCERANDTASFAVFLEEYSSNGPCSINHCYELRQLLDINKYYFMHIEQMIQGHPLYQRIARYI